MPPSEAQSWFPFFSHLCPPLLSLQVTECLTTVKSVNKTDSQTLLTTFGVRNNSRVPTDISTCFAFRGSCPPISFYLLVPPPHPSCLPRPLQDLPALQEYCTPIKQLGAGEVLGLPPLTIRFYLPQSLEQLIAASREDLSLCPGLGPQKVRAWGNGLEGLRAGGSPKEMGPQIPKF